MLHVDLSRCERQERILSDFGFTRHCPSAEESDAAHTIAEKSLEINTGCQDFAEMRFAVEALSGGKNTVIIDEVGKPSIMVRVPAFKASEVLHDSSERLHPMFIAGGKEHGSILISKYENVLINGRGYSLPFRDPCSGITFDDAKLACDAKGFGWHMMTNAEWAGIALWSAKNRTLPRGNNLFGGAFDMQHERGVVKYRYEAEGKLCDGRVATGSGPATWTHDRTTNGIYDLCGNLWEWLSGARLVDGEIQIIAENDAALASDLSENGKKWQAIMPDGTLTAPKTCGTLKFNGALSPDEAPNIATSITCKSPENRYNSVSFDKLKAEKGIVIPEIMRLLALFPAGTSENNGHIYTNNCGERLAFRGGDWDGGAKTGVFALSLMLPRTYSGYLGFRSSFLEQD